MLGIPHTEFRETESGETRQTTSVSFTYPIFNLFAHLAPLRARYLQAPRDNPGKNGFGVWGGLGAIFTVTFANRVARKFRRIILLYFGLITFRFHFGKAWKPFVFMIFGFLDVFMTPPNQFFLTLETPGLLKKQQKNCREILFLEISQSWTSTI